MKSPALQAKIQGKINNKEGMLSFKEEVDNKLADVFISIFRLI